MKKFLVAFFLAAVLILAVVKLLTFRKGNPMWPQNRDRTELQRLLGPAIAPGLDNAEITAWTPDLNRKAQTYFIVGSMTEKEFREWFAKAQLTVSEVPTVPPGIWVLPGGVKPSNWVDMAAKSTRFLEVGGETPGATIWSRWSDGIAHTVVHPAY